MISKIFVIVIVSIIIVNIITIIMIKKQNSWDKKLFTVAFIQLLFSPSHHSRANTKLNISKCEYLFRRE